MPRIPPVQPTGLPLGTVPSAYGWTASNATRYTGDDQRPTTTTTMTYREPLPDNCPPDEAEEITSPRIVYRLVRSILPTDDDFRSQRAERPNRIFRDVTECQARGLSVFATRNVAERLSTSGRLQGLSVCQVTLVPRAGHIQPTGRRSHHTWWPLAGYDILANCQVVAP